MAVYAALNCCSAWNQCSWSKPCFCPCESQISYAFMLISASDGAVLAFFGGLCEKTTATAVCIGFTAPDTRELGDGFFPVFVVIIMFFLILTLVCSELLMRLGPCNARNKRRGKTPWEGQSDTW